MHRNAHFSPWRVGLLVLLFICCVNRFWTVEALNPLPGQHAPHIDFANHDETIQSIQYNMLLHFLGLAPNMAEYQVSYQNQILKELEDELRRTESSQGLESLLQNLQAAQLRQEALRAVCDSRLGVVHSDAVLAAQNDLLKFFNVPSYGDLCLAFDHYMKKCSSQVEEASNALESAEVALFVAQPQVQIRMQGLKRFRSLHKSLTDVLLLVHENGPEWRRYREGILETLNEGSVTVDLMGCNHVLPTLMSYVCIHQTQFSKVPAEPMTSQACPSDVVKDLRTIRTLEWEILRAQFIVGLRNFTDQELSDMKHQVEMGLTGLKSSRIQPVPTFDAHRTEVQATYEMYFDSVPHEEIGKPQATTFAIPFPKIPFELFADDLERNFLSDTPSDLVGSWSLLLEDLVRSKKEMQRAFTSAKGESPHGRYFDSYFHRCLNLTRTMDYMKASYGIAEIPLLARSEDSVIHYWYEVIGLSQAQQIKRSLVKLVPSLKLVPFTGLSDQLLRFKSDAYRAFRHISLQLLGWKQSPLPPPQTMPVGGKIGRLSRAETTHELMGEMEDATLSFRLCLETVRRAARKRAYNSESDRQSQTWPWYTTAVDMCSVALKAYISKNGAMQTAWKDQFRTQDIGIWHAKFQDAHERLHTDNIVYSQLTSSHDNRLFLQSLPLVIKRFIVNLDLVRHRIACAQAPNLELTKALTLIESVNIDPVELERIAWDRFVYLQQVTKMLHWDVIRLEEHQSHLFHLQLNALEQVYAIAQDGSAPLKSEILQIHNSVTRFRSLVLDALEMDKLLIDRSEDSIKHSWWQHLDSFEAFRTDFTSLIQHLKSSVSLGKNVRLKVMIRSLDDNNQICEFIQDRYLHVSDSLYAVDLFEGLRMARNEVATTQHTPKEFHYSPIQRVALHLCGGKTCPPEIIQMLKELREKEYLMTRSIIVGLMEIFNDDILQDLSVSLTHQYAKLKHSVPEENESADHHGNDLIFSSWIPALQKIQYLITETELLSVHLTAPGSLEDNPRVSDRVLDELIALGIFTTANRPSQLTRIELEIVLSEHVSRYVATVMASLPHIVFLDAPNKLSSQTSDPMLDYLFLKHDLEYIVAEQETRGLFFLHHQLLRSALHEKVWSLRSALSLVRNEPILAPSLVLVQRRMALHFFRASYEAYVTVKQWSMDDASLRYDTVLSNMQNLVAEEQQQFSRKLLRAAQRAAWGHSAQASTSSGMDKGDPSSAARPNPSSMVPVPEGALLRLFHVLRILMSDLLAHPIAPSKPDQPEPYDKKVRMYSLLSSFMRDQLNHDPMFHIEFTAVRESLSFLALLRRHAFEFSTSRHVGEKTPAPTTTEPSFAELLMNRCKDILRFRTAGVLLNAERLIDGFYVQQVLSPSDTTSPSDTEDKSPMTHLSIPSTRQWSIYDLSTTPLLDNPLRHGLSTYEKQRRPPRPGEALPVRRTGPSSDHSKRRRDVAWLVVLVVLGVTCAILTAYTIRVVFKEYLQERTHNSFSRHDLAELEDYDSRTFI